MPNPSNRKQDDKRESVRARALTETIRVPSPDSVPEGYVVIPFPSLSIFAKAQVLSRRHLMPIFVETEPDDESVRQAYWVHESIMPELVQWIRDRVFTENDAGAG
jgi:hypothetical protein